MIRTAAALLLLTTGIASTPALAADYVLTVGPGMTSTDFGSTVDGSGALDDRYFFTVPDGSTSGFVGSIALSDMLDVVIDNVYLDETPFVARTTGDVDFYTLGVTNIDAGQHYIRIVGSWGQTGGSYSGTLNFSPSTGAIPEPASWAMMIGGFGLVGGTLRRRKAQTRTAVTFG